MVVTGDKDITAPTKYTKDFINNLEAKVKSVEIKECDHTFSTQNSADNLLLVLTDWFKRNNTKVNVKTLQDMQLQKD